MESQVLASQSPAAVLEEGPETHQTEVLELSAPISAQINVPAHLVPPASPPLPLLSAG